LFRKKLRRAPVEVEVNTALNLRIGVFEQVFAKLKHLLPEAAARTVEAVWDAIGQLLPAFTPKECANYFENAAYAST